MRVEPVHDHFVGRATGLSLQEPLSPAVIDFLTDALDRWLVLLVPGITADDRDLVELGRCLGELEDFAFAYRSPDSLPAVPISNLDEHGRIRAADDPVRLSLAGDALWHTDNSYRPKRARYSMLLARTVPEEGGTTEFCDTRAAYDALPPETRAELEGLVAHHSLVHSRALAGFTAWTPEQLAKLEPVRQPLILTNPHTGRRSLYLASHIFAIDGLSEAETRDLVVRLTDFATQPRFVYTHEWHVNDLVIWDDRATMHRRGAYDDLRQVRVLVSLRVVEPSLLAPIGASGP